MRRVGRVGRVAEKKKGLQTKLKLSLAILFTAGVAAVSIAASIPKEHQISANKDHQISANPEPGARIGSNSIIDIVPTEGSIWFGTGRGLSQLHLNGTGWATLDQSDGLGRGGVSALAVTDSTIWAATAYTEEVRGDFFPAGGGVGYSRDDGETWTWMRQPVDSVGETNYSPTTTNIQNVTYDIALTDSAAWIVSWGGGLRRLKYGESAWHVYTVDGNPFSPGPPRNLLAHRTFSTAYDGTFLWVGSAAGVHRTSDEGANWNTFSHVAGNNSTLSGNFVTALGVQKLTAKTLVWAATWRAEQVNEYYGVTVTEDGGANWRVALSDSTVLDNGEYLIDVYGPLRAHNFGFSDSVVYVCADEVLWQSNDLGFTWTERASDQLTISDPTTGEEFVTTDFFSAAGVGDSLWVGSDDGLAVGWFDGEFKWRIHRAFQSPGTSGQPDTYSYPNPFSPARGHTVRFQFPLGSPSSVHFEVFNFAMEPVYSSPDIQLPGGGTGDQAEYGAVAWDGKTDQGNSVANGVYFYLVKAGGNDYWGKVMVLD